MESCGDCRRAGRNRRGSKEARENIMARILRPESSDGGLRLKQQALRLMPSLVELYQKLSLIPNCISRGPRLPPSTPKLPLPRTPHELCASWWVTVDV